MRQPPAIKATSNPQLEARPEEPVLVFESSLTGKHSRGIALLAEKCHGAVDGKGFGPEGLSYAIPTANSEMAPLTRDIIANYVRSFLNHAAAHSQLRFRVTALGVGNPYLKIAEMAGMFRDAPKNCLLPGRWLELLGKLDAVRILVLDGAGALRNAAVQTQFDEYFALNAPLWSTQRIDIVSVGSPVSVVANDQYARSRKYRHRIVSVNEQFYKNYLNQAREEMAVWYAARMVTISDPDQTAQSNQVRMLQAAMRAGLEIDEISVCAG